MPQTSRLQNFESHILKTKLYLRVHLNLRQVSYNTEKRAFSSVNETWKSRLLSVPSYTNGNH